MPYQPEQLRSTAGATMARASTPTLLSLDRFAQIMGINPVHFNGASAGDVWPRAGACDETWVQHPWQTVSTLSREELAREIRSAEVEIGRYLGWDVAPTWHIAEEKRWPNHYDRTVNVPHYDSRLNQPSIDLSRSKVIAGGRRAWEVIDASVSVVYSDEDGDGFEETATITASGTYTDKSEIKLYFDTNHNGNPSWEVRPVKSIEADGATITIVCDSWLLLDPSLWESHPTGVEKQDIDASVMTNYVTTVDVLRVYNDVAQASSQLRWRSDCLICNGSGCAACSPATQDGCMSIIDARRGIVQPKPAVYTDGAWVASSWDSSTRPETVRFWYYSGEISQDYDAGYTLEEMDLYWAEAVSWLCAARLNRPLCSCDKVMSTVNAMQTDMLLNKRESGARFIPGASYVHNNPLGFRYGEVRAWLRINEAMDMKGGIT